MIEVVKDVILISSSVNFLAPTPKMQNLTLQIISAFHLSVFWSVLIVKSLFSSNNQWWTIWMAWPNWLLKSHFNIFLWSEALKDNGWEHYIVLYTSFFQYGQNFMSEIDFYASICCIGYNPLYLSWRLHGTRDYWWHTRTHVTDWLLCWGWADMVTNLLQLKISKKNLCLSFKVWSMLGLPGHSGQCVYQLDQVPMVLVIIFH